MLGRIEIGERCKDDTSCLDFATAMLNEFNDVFQHDERPLRATK
jgi:hypothetical protein